MEVGVCLRHILMAAFWNLTSYIWGDGSCLFWLSSPLGKEFEHPSTFPAFSGPVSPPPSDRHCYPVGGIVCFHWLKKREGKPVREPVECDLLSSQAMRDRPTSACSSYLLSWEENAAFWNRYGSPNPVPAAGASRQEQSVGTPPTPPPGDGITFSNQVLGIRLVASNLLGPRPEFPGLPPPLGSFPSSSQPEAC